MSARKTPISPFNGDALAEAARRIRRGELVAVPTETVYGLAADATNPDAVARIYATKGRPSFNPLIVHVRSLVEAERIAFFGREALMLARAFWPGPLTLVLPRRATGGLAPAVSAGLPTVALRMPKHHIVQALLTLAERPLAAPSANRSGGISPTTAAHVAESLGEDAPMILDGGPTERGVESTIVALGPEGARLLRPGPISVDQLREAGVNLALSGGNAIEAPGMMASHYAPSKPMRLDAVEARDDEWLIGFGTVEGDESLSVKADLAEAAANLFAALHRAEAAAPRRIAVAPVPDAGLGAAINDRLRRAAAPRPETT